MYNTIIYTRPSVWHTCTVERPLDQSVKCARYAGGECDFFQLISTLTYTYMRIQYRYISDFIFIDYRLQTFSRIHVSEIEKICSVNFCKSNVHIYTIVFLF